MHEQALIQTDSHPLVGKLAQLALCTAGAAMVVLVAVQAWQVFARYILNDSPGWTEPLAVLLLSTVMSLGAAVGVHADAHFSFRLLSDAAPAAAGRGLQTLRHLIVALLGLSLALWSGALMVDGLGVAQSGIGLPQGASYAPLAVGGALMALFAGERLWLSLRTRKERS